ncbi:MAG: hypothetical protein JF615_03585 [Asticcacaulis sp.]|nr:hypothetical protein [Asticcacaulis sp.]
MKRVVLAILLLWAPAVVAAPQPTPDWGSDRVRAERPVAGQDSLVFDYIATAQPEQGEALARHGEAILAGDFNVYVTAGEYVLDDFRLCRVLSWREGQAELDNSSCYAAPALRVTEMLNRKQLDKLLTDAAPDKTTPGALDLAWSEQELATQVRTADPLTAVVKDDETQYWLGQAVAARISRHGFAFTAAEKPAVARYLARHVNIHPQVRRAILASGVLPDRIVIMQHGGAGPSVETIAFSNFRRTRTAYPLPDGLTSTFLPQAGDASRQARAVTQAMAVIAGTGPARPDFQRLLDQVSQAARDGKGMQGALLIFELTQVHTGALSRDEGMARLRGIGDAVQSVFRSDEAKPLVDAGRLASDRGAGPEREVAARYLAGAKDLDSLQFGTFRYVTYANLARYSDDSQTWDKDILNSMPSLTDCYWTHIAAAPWGANVYKDLGDTYYADFDMESAWAAWDLGRAADPDWASGVMTSTADFEGQLRAGQPDSF